jgi:hypothetical protein
MEPMDAACDEGAQSSWGAFEAPWPVFLLLGVPVGGLYANLALCVGMRREKHGLRTHIAFPYAWSLACGDLVNCMLVMPIAVINASIRE